MRLFVVENDFDDADGWIAEVREIEAAEVDLRHSERATALVFYSDSTRWQTRSNENNSCPRQTTGSRGDSPFSSGMIST